MAGAAPGGSRAALLRDVGRAARAAGLVPHGLRFETKEGGVEFLRLGTAHGDAFFEGTRTHAVLARVDPAWQETFCHVAEGLGVLEVQMVSDAGAVTLVSASSEPDEGPDTEPEDPGDDDFSFR